MTDLVTVTAPATLGFVTDVDALPDGRLIVTDGHLTAILKSDGSLDRYLPLPTGSNADTVETNRLVVVDGGVILADSLNDRFIFYDSRLEPEKIVPFGFDLWSLNGFVRNPESGELYIGAYFDGRLLHRFDKAGHHLESTVDADPEVPQGMSSIILTLDPEDNSLWISRLDRYEILRMTDKGLQTVVASDAPEFRAPQPKPGSSIAGKPLTFRIRPAPATSVGTVIHGQYVLNTYYLVEQRTILTDVFKKDGSPVARGIHDNELVAGKVLADGRIARIFEHNISIWR
ncbi:MAG TPA: hypothetical protein VNI57_13030 [Candidatus Saccharimonadales bacterium]|nr:hypothetical protein [Candidatus Saccharimonadales bacterium]